MCLGNLSHVVLGIFLGDLIVEQLCLVGLMLGHVDVGQRKLRIGLGHAH